MNFEIVDLEEKVLVGIKERCSNYDEEINVKIGKLWKEFFKKGIYSEITGKVNGKAIDFIQIIPKIKWSMTLM